MLELCAARPSNKQRNNTEGLGVDDPSPLQNREQTMLRRHSSLSRTETENKRAVKAKQQQIAKVRVCLLYPAVSTAAKRAS